MSNHEEYKAIDLAKFFFCLCIVFLHTDAIRSFHIRNYEWIITQYILRLAVPFFFVTSGYFLGKKLILVHCDKEYWNTIKAYCLRLIKPLIVFESLNIIVPLLLHFRKTRADAAEYLLGVIKKIAFYPEGALWYIQASIIGVLLLYLARKLSWKQKFMGGGYCTALH